jgi:hypothetical protein
MAFGATEGNNFSILPPLAINISNNINGFRGFAR